MITDPPPTRSTPLSQKKRHVTRATRVYFYVLRKALAKAFLALWAKKERFMMFMLILGNF